MRWRLGGSTFRTPGWQEYALIRPSGEPLAALLVNSDHHGG